MLYDGIFVVLFGRTGKSFKFQFDKKATIESSSNLLSFSQAYFLLIPTEITVCFL